MTIYEKLSEIQQKIKVPKGRMNEFGNYRFRSAEDIMKAFKKFEEGYKVALVVDDEVVCIGSNIYVKSIATLIDLETDGSVRAQAFAKEPPSSKAKMDESQTTGSTSSYARKYALSGLFLLDDTVDPDSTEAMDNGLPAAAPQVAMIEELCEKHNVNKEELYKRHKVKGIPTAAQAGKILGIFKKQFGGE